MKGRIIIFSGVVAVGFLGLFAFSEITNKSFVYNPDTDTINVVQKDDADKKVKEVKAFSHMPTPSVVRAIYSTMSSIGLEDKRNHLLDTIGKTEINSIVIDFKGSGGEILTDYMKDVGVLVSDLHQRGIYVIARLVVFQDSGIAKTNPELVLKRKDGSIWRDRRGFAWSDASSQDVWENEVKIAKQAIDLGFDEINYDYVRFPTDGNLDDIVYPVWDGVTEKSESIKGFAHYSYQKLKEYDPNIKTSLDIFGYTFIRDDGLGIGQKLPDMVDNFDYVCPMVYPSHYSTGNFGFQNPADHPYEVINGTLSKGLDSLGDRKEEVKPKIRPWIQVFDLGAVYTPEKIGAEIKAVYDVLGTDNTGWLMWSPSNNYDRALNIQL